MSSRGQFVTLLLSLTVASLSAHAQISEPASPTETRLAAIAGKVLNIDGKPVPGIHVELDDPGTAVPVTSTYTQPDGTFELYNVPKGNYEVVAESPTSEVSHAVLLDSGLPSFELRLPDRSSGNALDATTSVARMLVPAKAQKLFNRAFTDFNAGKYDEADMELDAALQIDREYADAMMLRGLIQVTRSDLALGAQYLEQAVKDDPSESSAYIALAAIYNHQGRFDDAMHASEKGLSLAPRTWQAYLEMAKASIAKSMYHAGLRFLRQAERLGGNTSAEVHLVKAYALTPLSLYNDAKYELRAALARQHGDDLAAQAQDLLAKLNDQEAPELAAKR